MQNAKTLTKKREISIVAMRMMDVGDSFLVQSEFEAISAHDTGYMIYGTEWGIRKEQDGTYRVWRDA